ncbi:hypothetical protein B0H16DRAFT_1482449 [Mycena metata]|uniref:Uncharacterized protein n=1 Tax=Mycena metata TaxID=1033252 RepID=A0AAD7GU27_9AGAR|nr:hypothetical protein B0H16DRAFT_1482449 [Mycena metata]
MSTRTNNLLSKYSIPKMHGIDINVNNFILTQVLPTADIRAAFDASCDQKRISRATYSSTIFARALRPTDITTTYKNGVMVAELNRNIAAKLWKALLTIVHYVQAAARHKTARSIAELGPVIPKDHLTSLQVPFPSFSLLLRHSGANPFFVNPTMGPDEIATLWTQLQYVGKIALCWIDYTTYQCIYRDSFARWNWTHFEALQPLRKSETGLRRMLRAVGDYTSKATEAYFAGDERFFGYEADFDYSPTGHGKLGALRVICQDPEDPVEPAPTCIECGNSCCDMILHPGKSNILFLFSYADTNTYVEMKDVSDEQQEGKDLTDEQMAEWMSKIKLEERLATRRSYTQEADRYLGSK